MAGLRNVEIPAVGITTIARLHAVTFGAFAGRDKGDFLIPCADGDASVACRSRRVVRARRQWHRAWYYPKPGEDMHAQSTASESDALQRRIVDASTWARSTSRGA